MKCSIILAVIACVLSVDKAHSQVMNYVQKNMGPIMRGNTVHLECFNGFLPLINSLATKARDVSNGCVIVANFEKDQELSNLHNARLIFAAEVSTITDSLTDCSKKGGLDYFQCLENNAEANRKMMETIKNNSKDLMGKYSAKSNEIDSREQECIMRAVTNGQAESEQAFVDLKSCIKDGPIIQTQIDVEGTTTDSPFQEIE